MAHTTAPRALLRLRLAQGRQDEHGEDGAKRRAGQEQPGAGGQAMREPIEVVGMHGEFPLAGRVN
jgi:hypothetical protein